MTEDSSVKPTFCAPEEIAACCAPETNKTGCCGPRGSAAAEAPAENVQAEGIKIEVVGPGCASCQQLHEIAQRAATEIEQPTSVVYLSGQDGMRRMMELGMMSAPILVVDGKIAMVGYSPSVQKIRNAILDTAAR